MRRIVPADFQSIFVLASLISLSLFSTNILAEFEQQDTDNPNVIVKRLGVVSTNTSTLVTEFSWKNTYPDSLKIKYITRSCSCIAVQPEKDHVIEPGETVTFTAKSGISSWRGHSAISFSVFFDNSAEYITFRAEFFVDAPMEPEPKQVDFGLVDNPSKAHRPFSIEWVVKPDQAADIELLPDITSEKGMALCRLIHQETNNVRNPNGVSNSTVRKFRFEVYLAPGLRRGEIADTIIVPFQLEGSIKNVQVPVKGFYRGEIYAVPSCILWIQSVERVEYIGPVASLVRQEWYDEPNGVRVICRDDRVTIDLVKPTQDSNGNTLNRLYDIYFALDAVPIEGALDTSLEVKYTHNEKEVVFDVPVKIVVLQ